MSAPSYTSDLFFEAEPSRVELGPGAVLLRGFARTRVPRLMEALEGIVAVAPFRHFVTPGGVYDVGGDDQLWWRRLGF